MHAIEVARFLKKVGNAPTRAEADNPMIRLAWCPCRSCRLFRRDRHHIGLHGECRPYLAARQSRRRYLEDRLAGAILSGADWTAVDA